MNNSNIMNQIKANKKVLIRCNAVMPKFCPRPWWIAVGLSLEHLSLACPRIFILDSWKWV